MHLIKIYRPRQQDTHKLKVRIRNSTVEKYLHFFGRLNENPSQNRNGLMLPVATVERSLLEMLTVTARCAC